MKIVGKTGSNYVVTAYGAEQAAETGVLPVGTVKIVGWSKDIEKYLLVPKGRLL